MLCVYNSTSKGYYLNIENVLTRELVVQSSYSFSVTRRFNESNQIAPFDPSFVSAEANFLAADDTIITVPGTLVSEDLAKIKFDLTPAQSALLKVGYDQTFEIFIDDGYNSVFFKMYESLNVIAR